MDRRRPRLIVWFALVTLTGIPLGLICSRFTATAAAMTAISTRASGFRASSYLVFTLGWASMGFLLWAPGNDLNHMIVIMLLACTVAGNGALVGREQSHCWPLPMQATARR